MFYPQTQNRTDSIRVQKNELNPTRNANPTQPNPTLPEMLIQPNLT